MEPYLSALRNEVVLAGHTHTYGRNILEKETNQTGLTKGKKKKRQKSENSNKTTSTELPLGKLDHMLWQSGTTTFKNRTKYKKLVKALGKSSILSHVLSRYELNLLLSLKQHKQPIKTEPGLTEE